MNDSSRWFIRDEPDNIIMMDEDTRKRYSDMFQLGNRLGSPVSRVIRDFWKYIEGTDNL